jgi:hypothetical protein
LSSALGRKFPGTKTDGVPYPADVSGAFSGGANPKASAGGIKMATMAKNAMSQGYTVVLSGYSKSMKTCLSKRLISSRPGR